MGDRCTIVFSDGTEKCHNIGVYLHWHGDPEFVQGIVERMQIRDVRSPGCDMSYATARFVQEAANKIVGTLSIGLIYTPDEASTIGSKEFIELNDPGDNGIYVIGPYWKITKRFLYGKEVAI